MLQKRRPLSLRRFQLDYGDVLRKAGFYRNDTIFSEATQLFAYGGHIYIIKHTKHKVTAVFTTDIDMAVYEAKLNICY